MSALAKGNKHDINKCLRQYKQPNGVIYFPALFAIPSEQRLPALPVNDVLPMLVVGLTLAFETMNLARGMNDNQVIDLAEIILESSSEDNLSLEDVVLFLQQLTTGKYGKLYESMDIPKFMDLFEKYREERWQAIQQIRYEQTVQHNAIPINERIVESSEKAEREKDRQAMKDYLNLNLMKDSLGAAK